MTINRGALDNTLAAMFSNLEYQTDYLFYAHIIGQCSIKIREDIPAPAGVAFMYDHYNLYINPFDKWEKLSDLNIDNLDEIDADSQKEENGVKLIRTVKGFDSFNLKERLAILKHEMLHILYGHIDRLEDRQFIKWNYSTDCALNQHIDRAHLPKSAILPKDLGVSLGIKLKENESAEYYYDKLKEHASEDVSAQSGKQNSSGSDQMDDHTTWAESKGDKDFQADLTKRMLDKAQNETIKNKGSVPNKVSEWLELHSRKSEVNWKKVLRGLVGNKRTGSRPTIMRPDRRFPKRADLRGKIKERTFSLLVVADVSGSMGDQAILNTIAEVKHICDITKTDIDLIQVDTEAFPPEKISKSTKLIERKSAGGTHLSPAISMAHEHKIDYQAVVVLTDGYLFDEDIAVFRELKKKVIWLIEAGGKILPEITEGRMQAFKLKSTE